ncbi:hypothetical protein KCU65_g7734, partial [Aureobasidium melanogenum]
MFPYETMLLSSIQPPNLANSSSPQLSSATERPLPTLSVFTDATSTHLRFHHLALIPPTFFISLKGTKACASPCKRRIRQPPGSIFCACIICTLLGVSQLENLPTSAMAHSPPFSSLPYEMVSEICQHPDMDKEDLAALRLTCKSYGVHDAATRSLGKCFENITVLFTKHSFETLVKICEHQFFRQCVRSVKLSSVRCNPNAKYREIVAALQLEEVPGDLPNRQVPQLDAISGLSIRMQDYVSRAKRETEFCLSAKHLTLLTRALRCLAQAKQAVAVGTTKREKKGLGYSRNFPTQNPRTRLWHIESMATMDMLVIAVSRSKLPVRKLTIDTLVHYCPPFSTRTRIPNSANFFSRMEEIDLEVAWKMQGLVLDENSAHALREILEKSTRLRSLRLTGLPVKTWDFPSIIEGLLSSVTSLCLESISFAKLQTTELELQKCLAKVQRTLRRLRIHNCQMKGRSWIKFITWIKHNLTSLEELHLSSLTFVWPHNIEPALEQQEVLLLSSIDAYSQTEIQSSLAKVLLGYENRPAITSSS